MSPTSIVYVYGLIERPRRPVLSRVPVTLPGASSLELVEIGPRLWAVTSHVARRVYDSEPLAARIKDLNWVADAGLAHETIVERLVRMSGATVVPMKLFTLFSSQERLRTELRARERELRMVLDRIRGCQEWGVRISPATPPRASAARRATSGTAFLTAKKRSRDEARAHARAAAQTAAASYASLARLARAAERREAPREAETPPLLDAAFLVRQTAAARFRTAVRRAAIASAAAGATLLLTGPWPAYSFVRQPA